MTTVVEATSTIPAATSPRPTRPADLRSDRPSPARLRPRASWVPMLDPTTGRTRPQLRWQAVAEA